MGASPPASLEGRAGAVDAPPASPEGADAPAVVPASDASEDGLSAAGVPPASIDSVPGSDEEEDGGEEGADGDSCARAGKGVTQIAVTPARNDEVKRRGARIALYAD